jgi:REP element-mobilizing transposase RayT
MSRPLRIEYPGALYHVTSRGDGRETIYLDDIDRKAWLALLGDVCQRQNWMCHTYCQMTNHYHLVMETPEGNLSKGMRQLNGVYTQTFNRRHRRVGHVFQGRYKAILVDKDRYLLELSRYVVLNPVRAGLVQEASEWCWSSYRATVGEVECPPWLQANWLLAQFGRSRRRAIEHYQAFVREGRGQPQIWAELKQQIYLGDEHFIARLQRLRLTEDDLREVPLAQRRPPAKPLAAYAAQAAEPKQAMTDAYRAGAYSMKEIARFFGVHYSTVSRAVQQGENKQK